MRSKAVDRYEVELVAEDALPPGVDWAFAEDRSRCCVTLFLKASAARSAEALAECWGAYRARFSG